MLLRNKFVLIISIFLVLSFSACFLFRNAILQYGLHNVQKKLLDRYRIALTIDDYGFEGIRDVYFRKIILAPLTGDTLVTAKNVELKINMGMLFRLKLGFKEIYADSVIITAVKKDSICNYSFLYNKSSATDSIVKNEPIGYHERFSTLLQNANRLFSSDILLRSIIINNQFNDKKEIVKIPELIYDGKKLSCDMITTSLTGVSAYTINSTMDAANSHYNFKVKRLNYELTPLPFFDLADSFKVAFDSAQFSIDANDVKSKLQLDLSFKVSNLLLNHWRISKQDVLFKNLGFEISSTIEDNRIAADSGSMVRLDKLPISISASYQHQPEQRVKLEVDFNTAALDFFNSLPLGMFDNLKGLQASGNLHYHLHFDLNKNDPDNLSFDSELKKENFRIIKNGEENFDRINEPFLYTAMDKERVMRTFMVGSENPMFTPLNEISDYLKNAVLTSEDPSFFTHSGFVEDAFRESIAENIKQGRFARGGSTISMQLVKNLFLSRNKTVSRKLEEVLIVWLIEKNHLVSKERMYEIYLNIIEWGPDVYGIGEASKFYFNKHPRELTLAESIFLGENIPHPKYYKYEFDSAGHLKPNQQGYFEMIANRLLTREKITQQDRDSLKLDVKLTGNALKLILPSDTVPPDSTEMEEMEILE